MVGRGSREGTSLSEGAHCRGLLYWGPWVERKALEISICLHGGSVGQPGVGSSAGNFGRWLKRGSGGGASLSLWEFCEGSLEGQLPCWAPWRTGRKGSGEGHFFPYGPH